MDFCAQTIQVFWHSSRGRDSVEDGELQGGARANLDYGEYLLACDQDGGLEGVRGVGECA